MNWGSSLSLCSCQITYFFQYPNSKCEEKIWSCILSRFFKLCIENFILILQFLRCYIQFIFRLLFCYSFDRCYWEIILKLRSELFSDLYCKYVSRIRPSGQIRIRIKFIASLFFYNRAMITSYWVFAILDIFTLNLVV